MPTIGKQGNTENNQNQSPVKFGISRVRLEINQVHKGTDI